MNYRFKGGARLGKPGFGMGCGCGCGKCGMGLFESGADFSQWGYAEWAVVALGGYVFLSMVNDTRRIASGAARASKDVRRKLRRRRRRTIKPIAGESLL